MSQEEKDQDFINKRKFSRIKLMDPIRLLTSQHSFEEYMGNISKTGCMILGLKEVPLGEKVKVAIKTPEHGYMDFECVVRRCIEKELEDIEDENKEIKDLLFVDDDQDIRALTATFLEEAFQADQFVIAANSEEAKEYLNQYFFRLALTDARMPKEDGAHLLEYIAKTQPECRRAMITGQANHELMQRAINKGNVEHVFYKPIDIPVLKSSLKELLEKTSIYETAKTTRQRYYNCYSSDIFLTLFPSNMV